MAKAPRQSIQLGNIGSIPIELVRYAGPQEAGITRFLIRPVSKMTQDQAKVSSISPEQLGALLPEKEALKRSILETFSTTGDPEEYLLSDCTPTLEYFESEWVAVCVFLVSKY